jgi:hypothetical protein
MPKPPKISATIPEPPKKIKIPPVLAEKVFRIGLVGSDAGYVEYYFDSHGHLKIVHVPGWTPQEMREFGAALKVVAQSLCDQAENR